MRRVLKESVIRLPITLHRAATRAAPWHVDLQLDDHTGFNPFTCEALTEADARRDLTHLVAGTLSRVKQGPVVVIGGEGQYADSVHIINPEPGGWAIHVIRQGRRTTIWRGDFTRSDALQQVLDNVGGEPSVISL
ncbi:hypothetical protein BDK92_2617 [Micromonospora pisi]|uniref:Uncharacterized protein n=1 Tax=Micromonospora pisi TaxID=589240 RepID=A0A495JH36_9ACTN|nr:hypothetical protein [Micromonospora pisi]RKR88306.1 hypothetical protein BDK92_2617 [Micromonospora pisi]